LLIFAQWLRIARRIIQTDEQTIEEGIRIIAEELERGKYTNSSPKSFFRF
jgi:hypothetical protein